VHRLEFPFSVNYLCYASWGACFAVDDAEQLLDLTVLSAIAVNLLLIVAALALNTAADIGTDERHPERHHLATAAQRLGRDRVIRWAATELTVALVLAWLVALWSGHPLVAAVAALIIAIQVLYNAEPVRLKRRGLTGAAAFCAAVIVLPFLLSYWAIRPDVDAPSWLIATGLGLLAVGRATLWSIPDLAADAMTGMRTTVVRYGTVGAMSITVTVMIAGLILTGWGLWWRYGPAWALPLVAVQGAFLYGSVSPSSLLRIRRRVMPPVVIGSVAMTVTPLIAA
jgi:4-hydroxybenzoate polyprenyltransferase